ncbi:MAG: glycosyltransferase family 2 protein [Nitrospinae bacterium]|nr:glycosyltransferase family 2 protein [Nitrospinota bacterium]
MMLVIVPAFNEEKALPGTLAELLRLYPRAQVLVVNDGSADGTSAVARRAGVRVVDLPVNMGIGVAMQTGYRFAREHGFSRAVQCDGDGQHPPAQIAVLEETMDRTGSAMVIGSRFVESGKEGFKSLFMRRQVIRFFSRWILLLCGVRVYDVTSGFRLVNEKAIAIFARDYPFDYPEPEAIVLLSRHGLAVAEAPVAMRERQGGVSSIGFFSGIYYVVKVSIGLLVTRLRSMR